MTPLRNCLADPAHAHDTNSLTAEVQPQHLCWMPPFPRTRSDKTFTLTCTPRGHQHQGHCNVGGGVCDSPRGIRNNQPCGRRRSGIDVVIANPEICQNLATWLVYCRKDRRLEHVTQCRHHTVKIAQCSLHLILRHRPCFLTYDDVKMLARLC